MTKTSVYPSIKPRCFITMSRNCSSCTNERDPTSIRLLVDTENEIEDDSEDPAGATNTQNGIVQVALPSAETRSLWEFVLRSLLVPYSSDMSDSWPIPSSWYFRKSKRKLKSYSLAVWARKIVLYDKDEKQVVVCLQAKGFNMGGHQDYEIYGSNSMYIGHTSKAVEGIDGPVYKWMELQGINEKPYYTLLLYHFLSR